MREVNDDLCIALGVELEGMRSSYMATGARESLEGLQGVVFEFLGSVR